MLSPASVTERAPGKDPASPRRRLTFAARLLGPQHLHLLALQSPCNTALTSLPFPAGSPGPPLQGASTPPLPYFRAPTPSLSSLHTCPTGFSLDSFGGFLSGALLLLSFLPWVPLPPTDPSTSEVTCRPSLQGLYVDTTCSSWIPITATTHSGLSSGQKHIPPQITVTCTPVLNPPRLQAS